MRFCDGFVKKKHVNFTKLLEKCKKCGMCLKIGCPAINKNDDGTITIEESMCNGCGLCLNYCKFGAINKVEK